MAISHNSEKQLLTTGLVIFHIWKRYERLMQGTLYYKHGVFFKKMNLKPTLRLYMFEVIDFPFRQLLRDVKTVFFLFIYSVCRGCKYTFQIKKCVLKS